MSVRGAVRAVARTLLVVVLLVAALGAAEVALRIAGMGGGGLLEYDPVRGWRLTAGVSGRIEGDGPVELRINDDGLRGPQAAALKPGGTLRIAIIGGSTTEAPRIPYDKTFCSIVESEMAGCASTNGQPVEVLNFGVEGYDLTQDMLTLRDEVWRYQPDLVVLAVDTARDFGSRPAAPGGDQRVSRQCRPRATLHDGALEVTYDFRDSVRLRNECETAFALRSLRLPRFLAGGASQIYRLVAGHPPSDLNQTPGPPAPASPIYGPPTSPDASNDWAVGEALITAMARDAADHQTRFVVVTLSNPMQVYPYPALRMQALRESGGQDIFYPEHQLGQLGDREGFPVIALAPEMQSYADEYRTYLHGDSVAGAGTGEWNAAGHLLGGEIIARDVCTLIGNKFVLPAPVPLGAAAASTATKPTGIALPAPSAISTPIPIRAAIQTLPARSAPRPSALATPGHVSVRATPLPPPPLALSIAPAPTPTVAATQRPAETPSYPTPEPTPLLSIAPMSAHILTPMGESTPAPNPAASKSATPLSTRAPPTPSSAPSASASSAGANPAIPPAIVSQAPIGPSTKPSASVSAAAQAHPTPTLHPATPAVASQPVSTPSPIANANPVAASPSATITPAAAATALSAPTPWALHAPLRGYSKSTTTPTPKATVTSPTPVATARPTPAPTPSARKIKRRQHHWHRRREENQDNSDYYDIE